MKIVKFFYINSIKFSHDLLENISKKLRIKVLELARKTGGKGSHLGGTFSSIEIVVALYYANILNFKKKKSRLVK